MADRAFFSFLAQTMAPLGHIGCDSCLCIRSCCWFVADIGSSLSRRVWLALRHGPNSGVFPIGERALTNEQAMRRACLQCHWCSACALQFDQCVRLAILFAFAALLSMAVLLLLGYAQSPRSRPVAACRLSTLLVSSSPFGRSVSLPWHGRWYSWRLDVLRLATRALLTANTPSAMCSGLAVAFLAHYGPLHSSHLFLVTCFSVGSLRGVRVVWRACRAADAGAPAAVGVCETVDVQQYVTAYH